MASWPSGYVVKQWIRIPGFDAPHGRFFSFLKKILNTFLNFVLILKICNLHVLRTVATNHHSLDAADAKKTLCTRHFGPYQKSRIYPRIGIYPRINSRINPDPMKNKEHPFFLAFFKDF